MFSKFCQYLKPISISLSPNTEKDDIRLAFKLIFQPWLWKNPLTNSGQVADLENEFKKYLGVKYAFSFNSGRSALMAILDSLDLEKDSEVLLQAFTCNAAANPIIWSGLKPVYVDCDEKTFNIDIEDLKKKITLRKSQGKRPKAVMIQHTFGLPADIDEILKICQDNNLILIEDCAHSLGVTYKSKKIGTFGKVAFFSFGRDKVISSVYGGMAVTNDDELAKRIREYWEKIKYPSYFWIKQQLLNPILLNWAIIPTYRFFGKYIFILLQELKILSKAVHIKEKRGEKPDCFPKRLPNALAILASNQFKKLEKFNSHRKEIAEFYRKELKGTFFELPPEGEQIYLRFTVKHPKAHEIIRKAWKNNLLLGDWYALPIAPGYSKLEKLKHNLKEEIGKVKNCPKAEKLAKMTLNLPTHINISKKDAQKIIKFLKET